MIDESVKPAEGAQGESEVDWYKKQLGRQANEIGEMRKVMDQFILKQDEATAPSFDDDPVAAMEREIEQRLEPIKQRLNQVDASTAERRLAERHPDYEQVIQDPQFQSYVQNSNARVAAFEAAIAGNIDAGISLIDDFKSSQPQTRDALQTALASNRGSSGEMGARESTRYKRADIIRKKIEDPQWYRDNQADILKAYAEGRVK